MANATLRFYEELNDYLPPQRRKRDFVVAFAPPCPLRHLVEQCGVPHTEIELALRNGESVDLECVIADGDRVSLYPMFESLDVTPLLRLRPAVLREPRFFADAHLGRLARYLRLLGFDTRFEAGIDDALLVSEAVAGQRIVLTRDRALLMRRAVTHGCLIRVDDPLQQLAYVVERCDLRGSARPFTRCMNCNGLLEAVDKQAVIDALEAETRTAFDAFWRCRDCRRVYWQGSHYAALERLVTGVLAAPGRG